ncbi:conserved unknown protein [Ectocarpus siliculosus]|uniref:Serine/threonine-protein phosphatase n=1 Tax=Ectocarpus siliculosus TaxID=2880 RepID=D8LDZ7_ECTSI|nr:conserved unknown protein [Ectocarpus siliculosus]|eukprot:CBN75573.1 conserved unknown protein [Ectocarpus siliculosus]
MEKEEPTLSRRDTHGPFARMGLGSKTSSKASMGGAGAEENERLHCVITEKDAAITALQFEVQRLSNELASHTRVAKREHPLEPVIHLVDEQGSGRPGGHMGRTASMATATALSSLQPGRKHDEMAQRVIRMFKTPKDHATYLTSVKFARDMLRLCARAGPIFENEPRCLFIQSPVYVFGDIHGNLEDLNFFSDNIWKLGMNLTAGKFLFLGDYVDRGMSGLECLAYLFALKIENPDKIFMLRGNHELRDVNGWVEHYGERSFLWQCQDRFGDDLGEEVWEGCNAVFDRLPLASVIDHDIFCVHGGIPRPLPESTSRVQDILCVPSVAGVCPPNEYETFESQQVASDCLWSDPARDNQEMSLDATGFGESLRGGGAICFGAKVINRSSKYKNRYIHRRDSLSLAALSLDDRDKLTRIGVVTNHASEGVPEDDEEYEEDEDDEEEEDEVREGGGSAGSGAAGQDSGKEGGNGEGANGKRVVDMVGHNNSANSRDTFDGYYDQRVDYSSDDEGKTLR